MNPSRTSPRTGERGFTLIEVLMATVIASIAVVGMSWTMSRSVTTRHELADAPVTPLLVAKEIHTLAMTLPRAPSGYTNATGFSGVHALDSLAGASFSPAIHADGSTISGWTQDVQLSVHDLSDFSLASGMSATDVVPKTSNLLIKLVVTASKGSQSGSFTWWLAP